MGVACAVVGGFVLRTLEARWRSCTHRVLRDRYDGWLYAALSSLSFSWRKEALGSRGDGLRCSSVGSLLRRAAADVHLYLGQSPPMAHRNGRGAAQASALDTTPVPPVAESARRIRARPCAVVGVWNRPALGDGRRQYILAAGAPHPAAGAAAPPGLFGARASQSQRRATLSLFVRHLTLARHAVVHCGVVLAQFS